MNVAVLTLTRDRLEYTAHCFRKLHAYAGCDFDHYVLDQGSVDGTQQWLRDAQADDWVDYVFQLDENVGINRGMNLLLRWIDLDAYDVVVKIDNDCELTQPDTLRDVASLVLKTDWLLSPRIEGLNNPPPVWGKVNEGSWSLLEIPQIGGIFLAVPAYVYAEGFRYDDSKLLDDDVSLCWWWRGQGGRCGYVSHLTANHYETTSGQHARFPEYFARTLAEGKAAL